MSGLVLLDGTPATKRQIPMGPEAVRGLLGGRDFLASLPALAIIRVIPRCVTCLGAGSDGAVVVTPDTVHPRTFVSCAHRSGHVKTATPLDLTKLLDALGWKLYCADCGGSVWGENDPQATTLCVTCACTTRVMGNPVAPASPTAA